MPGGLLSQRIRSVARMALLLLFFSLVYLVPIHLSLQEVLDHVNR